MSEEQRKKIKEVTGIELIALQKSHLVAVIISFLIAIGATYGAAKSDLANHADRIKELEGKQEVISREYNKTLLEISIQLSELKTEIKNLKGK